MYHSGRIWTAAAAVTVCVASLAGCDSAPGLSGPEGEPPIISAFSFSPAFVDIATLPPEQRTDTTAIVPLSIEVSARDEDGDLLSVEFVVQSLVAGQPPLAQGVMSESGSRYSAETSLVVPLGIIANYSVLVYAVDSAGQISNRSRGLVRFTSSEVGGPPVIESVEVDPPIVRPGATGTTFRLIAAVSDPDGRANILRVDGTAPNGSPFSLLDDGVSFGDETAGDGLYTARFEVPPSCDVAPQPCVSPSTQTFRIQAFDRSGLASDVFEQEVTIE